MKDLYAFQKSFEQPLGRELTAQEKEFMEWLHARYIEEQTINDKP